MDKNNGANALEAAMWLSSLALAFAFVFCVKAERRLKALVHRASTDSLTGVLNRRAFESGVDMALQKSARGAMLMFDLDEFKQLNDQKGHDAGDRALRSVSASLRARLRRNDLCGRLGGDEFAAYLPDVLSQRDAKERASALKLALELPCSVGVALAPGDGMTFEALYKRADKALYDAKRSGKNRFSLYSEGCAQ